MSHRRIEPKRRKVRSLAVLTLLALLLGAPLVGHGVFRWHARRALHASIESLRASGERVLPRDFVPTDSYPRDNAAPDLIAAAAIVDDDSEEAASISWAPATLPLDPRALPYLARAKASFEPALHRIERARGLPVCQWRHCYDSPVFERMLLPELNGIRALANLAWSAAMLEHHEGRHDLLVLRLRQALYLADTCESTPALVAHLTALAVSDGTAVRIESLAPTLRIGDGGAEVGDASPGEVRGLIATLLDETTIEAGFRRSVESQRMQDVDMLDHFAHGPRPLNPVVRYFYAPQGDVNTRRVLERLTRAVEAVRGTRDWPTAAARLDQVGPVKLVPETLSGIDSLPSLRRATEAQFARLTDRRLAATVLAVRLYQSDHGGRRPHALEELVPRYLPAVPLDAMAAGARPIRYLPSTDRPALYSVGHNGADELGGEAAMPEAYGEIGAWRRLDRVFYLGGQARESIYVAPPGDGVITIEYEDRPPWEPDEADTAPGSGDG